MNTIAVHTSGNVGRVDAVIRGVVAFVLLAVVLALDLNPLISFTLVALSVPTMLSAIIRRDPFYSMLGISTGSDRLQA